MPISAPINTIPCNPILKTLGHLNVPEAAYASAQHTPSNNPFSGGKIRISPEIFSRKENLFARKKGLTTFGGKGTRPPSHNIEAFRSILQSSKNIVAIAGAGLSAASGIPTYTGPGGLWTTHNVQPTTPRVFYADPSYLWQSYHYRRETALKAIPNAGHIALAMLAVPEHLKTIAPFAKFTLVTQNVDGLSPRAFREVCPSGEPTLFEMHGHLFETICTVCNDRATNLDSPICPALAGTEELMEKHEERVIPLKDLPRCHKPDCDGLLRPGVVWFEEMPYHLKEINKIIDEADLALVVGSSSTVYPVAGYASKIAQRGGIVAVFNIERSKGDENAHFLFLGPCEKTLPLTLFGKEVDVAK